MSFIVGENHYIPFFVGVDGLTTVDFPRDFFNFNGAPVGSPTAASFAVVGLGAGYYYAKYVPPTAGFYTIAFNNADNAINVVDVADILDIAPATADAVSVVNLSQDTGGPNALKPHLATTRFSGGHDSLIEYLLMVFSSSDWKVGRTETHYAHAQTQLDAAGNWRSTPLAVVPGTYHIIIRNNYGKTIVVKPDLTV